MNGKVLFACSKCFSRHPFEELSSGQQLCKGCRGSSYPVVKCTYCRSEFQQTSKASTSSICKKCEQNLKQHGKPTTCECCNIVAAFGSSSKCQRCASSIAKYGQPVACDQCKQRSAFDRRDENKKINGKLLCWLCTCSYKRAVAKAHQADKSAAKKRPHEKSLKDIGKKSQRTEIPKSSSGSGSVGIDLPEKLSRPSGNSGNGSSSAVGISNFGTIIAAPLSMDSNSSDHVVAMTQLKEQMASMQRRLAQKDRELLEKDKQITELRGKNWDNENDMRNKIRDIDRLYDIKLDCLNKKIATLIKEVVTLKKGNKKNGAVSNKDKESLAAKDSGGSGTDSPSTN